MQGRTQEAGSVSRIHAAEIEAVVIQSVRAHLKISDLVDDRTLATTHITRIDVKSDRLLVTLASSQKANRSSARAGKIFQVPWCKTS
jgi:hypothetical protein